MPSIFLHQIEINLEDEFDISVASSNDPVWGIPNGVMRIPRADIEYDKLQSSDFVLFSRNDQIVGCGKVQEKLSEYDETESNQRVSFDAYYRLTSFEESNLQESSVRRIFGLSSRDTIAELFKIPDNRVNESLKDAETPNDVLRVIGDQIREIEQGTTEPSGGGGGDGDGGEGEGGEDNGDHSGDGNDRDRLRETASDITQISIFLTGIIIAAASTLQKTSKQNPVDFGYAIWFGAFLLLASIPMASHVIIRTSVKPTTENRNDSQNNRPNERLRRFIAGAVTSTVIGVILIAVDAGLQLGLGLGLVNRFTIVGCLEALLVGGLFVGVYCFTYSPALDDA